MLTNLKKLMALSGAVAIVAMNVVPMMVNAAGVNPTFTVGVGTDNLANTADDVVTVTLPDALVTVAASDVLKVVITDSAGAVVNPLGKEEEHLHDIKTKSELNDFEDWYAET